MSGKGRGRGRGRGAVNFDALKRPGAADPKPHPKEKDENRPGQQVQELQHQVQELHLHQQHYRQNQVSPNSIPSNEVLESASKPSSAPISPKDRLLLSVTRLTLSATYKDVEHVVDLCKNYAVNDATFEDVVRAVYGRCQVDWQFARTAAMLCQQLCILPDDGPNFRNFFLKHIQIDFKEKDKLREKSNLHFLGCLSFLCQLFSHLRTVDGQRFQALITPVFEGLEALLDNRADTPNIECAAEQMLCIGRFLQQSDSGRMRKLLQTVRDFIVDSRGSRESRLSLIKVLECNASEWKLHSMEV